MLASQVQPLLSESGQLLQLVPGWAGVWQGAAVFGYGAPCQTFSVTGEFCSLMWSFSAFLLNMHLILL